MRRPALALPLAALLGWQAAAAQADSVAQARARFWVRPLASLIVPGAGQVLAHQDYAAVYIAAELYVLARFFQLTHEARQEGARFRDIAFDVARRPFTAVRQDTVFEYYETMERYTASGQFDAGSGPVLVPESDASTYNGYVWMLARRTFWTDPDVAPDPGSPQYISALEFYRTHAVGPEFLWSWRDASLAREVFRETIDRSDNAYRQAQDQLGLLLANHLVSAVDALISSRLSAAVGRPTHLNTWVTRDGTALVHLSIAF